MDKRTFLKTGGLAAAGLVLAPQLITEGWAVAQGPMQEGAPHRLPPLPYPHDALEPHIDGRTMRLHHEGHHQTYVDKLNAALKDNARAARLSLLELQNNAHELPEAIRNNAGGHYTHTLFWQSLRPPGTGPDTLDKPLGQAIIQDFGGMEAFTRAFAQAAKDQFGSGWAWLCMDPGTSRLFVTSTPNQDNPSMHVRGNRHGYPILGLDVWEHAYYLKYQNRRAEYIDNFWPVVNWAECGRRYQAALASGAAGGGAPTPGSRNAPGNRTAPGTRTTPGNAPASGARPAGKKPGRQGSGQ